MHGKMLTFFLLHFNITLYILHIFIIQILKEYDIYIYYCMDLPLILNHFPKLQDMTTVTKKNQGNQQVWIKFQINY